MAIFRARGRPRERGVRDRNWTVRQELRGHVPPAWRAPATASVSRGKIGRVCSFGRSS